MWRVTTIAVVVAGAVMTAGLAAQRDSPPARVVPVDVVGSSGNMSPIVENLDEAIHFYRDLIGMLMPRQPRMVSHADVPPPALLDNQGTPGARLRWVSVMIPGSRWRLELLEFTEIDRTPVRPRPQDPGAMTLVLQVRDIDALLARLKKEQVPVVTPGAQPVTLMTESGTVRAVVVKDPAGHFVELQQPDPLPAGGAPADGNILGARVRITVADTGDTLRLYREKLGFRPEVGTFSSDATRLRLLGIASAEFRVTTTAVPGVPDQVLEFIEFKGIDRTPLRSRISDPGASRIQLRVRDLPTAMNEFTAVGGTVTSTNGKSVMVDNIPSVIIRDMNNIFVILQQPAPTPTPANR
jgi:catechol 2,3-dioxygenase-like lactoylglutathione lyase family enzyme